MKNILIVKDLTDPQKSCQGSSEVFTSHLKYLCYKTAGVNQKCKYSKDLVLRTTDPQTAKGTYIGWELKTQMDKQRRQADSVDGALP